MARAFFVTGTDTDVGKTTIAAGLLAAANRRGLKTVAIKPIASGCERTPDGLRNADALLLQRTMSVSLSYDEVNPIALEPAIAPHLAAEQAGVRVNVVQLAGVCRGVLMQRADLSLVEGAGGWRVPLNSRELLSQLPKTLGLPVIMVVGMRLGCINHALLTAEAIARDGLALAGWVANCCVADMACLAENIATIKSFLRAPCLGEVPYLPQPSAESIANYLNCEPLIAPPV
ncbi:MAG TPA: dethiobiotin synthase [Spongiibacteraceae bacterium]|nr:dethiobiotin synthase [Spongiibacteraceae bacterium]